MRSSYFLCKNPSSEATSTKAKKALQYSAFTCRKSNPLLNFTFTLGHQFNTKHNISNFFPFFLFFLPSYTCFNKTLRVLQQSFLSSGQATPIQELSKNMSDQSRSIGRLLMGQLALRRWSRALSRECKHLAVTDMRKILLRKWMLSNVTPNFAENVFYKPPKNSGSKSTTNRLTSDHY